MHRARVTPIPLRAASNSRFDLIKTLAAAE
jgi:hypothetical protein